MVFGFTNPLLVTILILKNGGRFSSLSHLDRWCLGFGLTAFGVWWFAQGNPTLNAYAVYIGIIADAFAAIPTIAFVWKTPEGDRPFAWGFFTIGYSLTLLTVPEFTLAQIALPIYMTLGGASITIPLIRHRIRQRSPWKEWI